MCEWVCVCVCVCVFVCVLCERVCTICASVLCVLVCVLWVRANEHFHPYEHACSMHARDVSCCYAAVMLHSKPRAASQATIATMKLILLVSVF